MSVLPFTLSSVLTDKLRELKGSEEYDVVEMSVIEEEIQYESEHLSNGQDFVQYVNASMPRYVHLHIDLDRYLLLIHLHCDFSLIFVYCSLQAISVHS